MARKIPKLTPEEIAEFDRRTEELRQLLERRRRLTARLDAERARREERLRRVRRILTLGLSS
jgi:hypothetical protein